MKDPMANGGDGSGRRALCLAVGVAATFIAAVLVGCATPSDGPAEPSARPPATASSGAPVGTPPGAGVAGPSLATRRLSPESRAHLREAVATIGAALRANLQRIGT